MSEGLVTAAPNIIVSAGLGSCVAVALFDWRLRIGGLAHIMLPDSRGARDHRLPYRFADSGVASLLANMGCLGTERHSVIARIAGGACMFDACAQTGKGIGYENIHAVKRALKKEGIPVIGEDTGGSHGRSVEFHLSDGTVVVKAYGREDNEI